MIALSALLSSLSFLRSDVLFVILSFFTAAFCTFFFVPHVISIAQKYGILDVPGGIKKHAHPVAYLGGVALFAGFLVAVALWSPLTGHTANIVIGSTLLLLVGLVDDLAVLSPSVKFSGQLIAAICFIRAGVYLKDDFFQTMWAIPLSLFWVLSMINATNLIDVMDGLASTTSLAIAVNFFIFSLITGAADVAHILVAAIGALGAFLFYNKQPASIYLGDAGSHFLGGLLGSIPFLLGWSTYNQWGFLVPIIICAIPLCELLGLMIIRTYKRIPFYQGSPDHFCHYLKRRGWTVSQILGLVIILSLAQLGISLLCYYNYITLIQLIFLGLFYLFFWFIYVLKSWATPL